MVFVTYVQYPQARTDPSVSGVAEHQHTLQVALHFLRVFLHFFDEQSHLPLALFFRHFLVFFLSLHAPQGSSAVEPASAGHAVWSLGHVPYRG